MYQIDKDVPVQTAKAGRVASKSLRFPLDDMMPGDSFLVSNEKDRLSVLRIAKKRYKDKPEIQFLTRRVENGFRVWRLT
jgi:hypothetical protein